MYFYTPQDILRTPGKKIRRKGRSIQTLNMVINSNFVSMLILITVRVILIVLELFFFVGSFGGSRTGFQAHYSSVGDPKTLYEHVPSEFLIDRSQIFGS